MPIRVVIDEQELDAIPEGIRAEYKKDDDGRFYLEAEGIDDHPHVQGLRKTLKKFRDVEPNADRLKARLERLAPWESFGDDNPSEVRERLRKLEELEASGDGKEDEVKAKLEALYEKRLDAARKEERERYEKLEGDYNRVLAERKREVKERDLARALDEIGVLKEGMPGALARLKEMGAQVEEAEDGTFRTVFETEIDKLSAADFVKKWATTEEAKFYLPASGNNGSGMRGGTGGGSRYHKNPFAADSKNLTEQARLFRDNPALAKQMAADAGVKIG